MADTSAALAVQQPTGLSRGSVFGGLIPASFAEAEQFANRLAESGLVPEALRKRPADVLVVMLKGMELGLRPMLALSEIHVINGKAGCSAKLKMGMCLAKPDICADFTLIESNDQKATYRAQRVGKDAVMLTWTRKEAEIAGLLTKDIWRKFTPAQLRARCSSALADAVFPDIVQGILTDDELEDLLEQRAEPRAIDAQVHDSPAAALTAKLAANNAPARDQVINASVSQVDEPKVTTPPAAAAKPKAAPGAAVSVGTVLIFGELKNTPIATLADEVLLAQIQLGEGKIREVPEGQKGLKWVPQVEANVAAMRKLLEQRHLERQAAEDLAAAAMKKEGVKLAGGINSGELTGQPPAPVPDREPGSDDGEPSGEAPF